MQSFPYSFKLGRKTYSGQLFCKTGLYAGGSERTRTETTSTSKGRVDTKTYTTTSIHVKFPSEKVKTVTKSGTIDIPGNSAITVFYYKQKDLYYPFQIHVHDTGKTYSLTKIDNDHARRAILKWNPIRRLWGRTLDGVLVISTLLISFGGGYYISESMHWGGFATFLIGMLALFPVAIGTAYVTSWLGGSMLIYDEFKEVIFDITMARARELDKNLRQDGSDTHSEGVTVIDHGPQENTQNNEDVSFKPMF